MDTLAGWVGVGAGAAVAPLTVNTNMAVLTAVHNGQGVAQPEVQRSVEHKSLVLSTKYFGVEWNQTVES